MTYRVTGLDPAPFHPLYGVGAACFAQPGDAPDAILRLFANPAIAEIHAHNAVRGCFAAKVERYA